MAQATQNEQNTQSEATAIYTSQEGKDRLENANNWTPEVIGWVNQIINGLVIYLGVDGRTAAQFAVTVFTTHDTVPAERIQEVQQNVRCNGALATIRDLVNEAIETDHIDDMARQIADRVVDPATGLANLLNDIRALGR